MWDTPKDEEKFLIKNNDQNIENTLYRTQKIYYKFSLEYLTYVVRSQNWNGTVNLDYLNPLK